MFNDKSHGNGIKKFANGLSVGVIVAAAIALVIGIIMWSTSLSQSGTESSSTGLTLVLVALLGGAGLFVLSLVLYGFGVLVDNSQKVAAHILAGVTASEGIPTESEQQEDSIQQQDTE